MNGTNDWIDGWEVIRGADGTYGVYNQQDLVAGPFDTKEKALRAALGLPRNSRPLERPPYPNNYDVDGTPD
jgi:hypothetical protein